MLLALQRQMHHLVSPAQVTGGKLAHARNQVLLIHMTIFLILLSRLSEILSGILKLAKKHWLLLLLLPKI
jgi:hypothetical protein